MYTLPTITAILLVLTTPLTIAAPLDARQVPGIPPIITPCDNGYGLFFCYTGTANTCFPIAQGTQLEAARQTNNNKPQGQPYCCTNVNLINGLLGSDCRLKTSM